MPPIGRISAPMNGPIQANIRALGTVGVDDVVDDRRRRTIRCCEAEDDLDRQREGRRVADEAAEGHGVDDRHRPGVLVAEDPVLADQVLADGAGDHPQQPHGQRDHDGRTIHFDTMKPEPPTRPAASARARRPVTKPTSNMPVMVANAASGCPGIRATRARRGCCSSRTSRRRPAAPGRSARRSRRSGCRSRFRPGSCR